MSVIVVAGNGNVQTSVPVPGFPVPFAPASYPTGLVRSRVGGVGFNLAAALARLGHRVRLAGFAGDDPPGDAVRAAVEGAGIEPGGLVPTGETPQSVVLVAPDGQRAVHTDLKGLHGASYPADRFARLLDGANLAVLTNIGWCRPLLRQATFAGVPIATDVHDIADLDDAGNADWLHAATVLACSHERLPLPAADWARALLDRYGCAVHLVGLGAEGCLLAERGTPHRLTHVTAVAPRGVTDTTGAGDALLAGFLDGWARGLDPIGAARRAVVFAGWKVGATGADPGWLTRAELDARTGEGGDARP